jgi:hypothetical protein
MLTPSHNQGLIAIVDYMCDIPTLDSLMQNAQVDLVSYQLGRVLGIIMAGSQPSGTLVEPIDR